MPRTPIPHETQALVLVKSKRRCALCVFLGGKDEERKGQIAHLNRDHSDPRFENLVWLCFEHHDEFDSTTRQSKNYTEIEVRDYRDRLYQMHADPQPSRAVAHVWPQTAAELNVDVFAEALTRANALAKASVALEMSVCMVIYALNGGATLAAKKDVRRAYVAAGYDCEDHTGPDYKTISRRLNAAAALYEHMGGTDKVTQIIGGYTGLPALMALNEHLNSAYTLRTLSSVLAAAGKPFVSSSKIDYEASVGVTRYSLSATGSVEAVKPLNTEAGEISYVEAHEDHGKDQKDGATVLRAGQLHLVLPKDVEYKDVLELLLELKVVASRLHGASARSTGTSDE